MGKIHRNALKSGYQLHGYTIKEILGQGGFGITYLAHDTSLDRKVAIKEYLPIELAVREGDFSIQPVTEDLREDYLWGLERFMKEARTLAKFVHPNIVRVHSVFEENNTAYMVMEYAQGESLQGILTRRKTLEEAELLSILIPILGGLAIVHKAGFIHRDIKPANIFIQRDGSPVLLDFGSARQALGEQTKTLTSLVSPGYAPFEQYYSKGDTQGPWTDIYGLGATLYRAVADMAPQDAIERSRSIHETSKDTFVSAIEIGKGKYSSRFLKAIDHALKFKPTERPQSLTTWKMEFGIKDDLAEIKRLKIMEEQVTQPGTKVVMKPPVRLPPVTVTLFIIFITSVTAFYYQNDVKEFIKPFLPEDKEPELIEVTPSLEEIALAEQRAEKEAIRLQREQEIAKLLQKAEKDFRASRFIDPLGDNALERYLKILELDSSNTDAIEGKENIFRHFLESAKILIQKQEFDEAEGDLLRADVIKPDSREVRRVKVHLSDAKAKAQRAALEEERKRQETEQKRLAAEQKRKIEEQRLAAEQKRKIEEQRLAAEQKRKIEEQRLAAEQKRKIEEQRLAELRYALTVKPEPADATLRFLNLDKPYQPGMRLRPGSYHIEATAPGYVTRREWVTIENKDQLVYMNLEKQLTSPETVKTPPIDKKDANKSEERFSLPPP